MRGVLEVYTLDSLKQYEEYKEFIDLTKPEEEAKLKAECGKLRYLMGYPDFVKTKINDKESQIRSLDDELSLDIRSRASELLRIRRRQELIFRYEDLQKFRDELATIKEELLYAEKVKLLAEAKLGLYTKLLMKLELGGLPDDRSGYQK